MSEVDEVKGGLAGGVVGAIVAWSVACAGPESGAATRPAAEPILGGALFFRPPPQEYRLIGRSESDRSVHYATADGAGAINLAVVPQENAIGNMSRPMAQAILKKLRAEFEEGHTRMLMQPRLEEDPDLFIRIHERFTNGDGRTIDQIHIFRVIGVYLVSATVTAAGDYPEEVKRVHKLGEDVLWSVHTAAAEPGKAKAAGAPPPGGHPEPVTFARAGIRLLPPNGWNGETADKPEGVIATYRDPARAGRTIVVAVRPLTDAARRDQRLRDDLLREMMEGDGRYVTKLGATATGRVLPQRDARFLRKARMSFLGGGGDLLADSRQLIAGGAAVSVLSISAADDAAGAEKAGDALAASVRARPTLPAK